MLAIIASACKSGAPVVETQVDTPEVEISLTPVQTATQIAQETQEMAPARLDYEPDYQETACPFDLPPGQVEGQTVECGILEVPENRADPNSRQIRLAVAIFRHPDGATQPDPIIYLSGGPGGSSLELLNLAFDQVFAPYFTAGRDLIFFDQRGIGLSVPALDCPAVQDLSIDLLDNQVGGRQLSDQEAYDLVLNSFLSCGEDLEAGADLSAYNTLTSAADVNDLRIALGYDQVNLWGGSYGTRLALGVMRDYPEGLRSVVLDSAYPPDVDLYLDAPKNANRAFKVLFDACAEDPVCNLNYPDLREVFFNTVELLEARPYDTMIMNPLTGESFDAVIDGETLMGLIFQLLYETELLPNLPMLIYQANQGDFEMLSRIYGLLLVEIPLISRGMSLSVQCNEEMAFSSLEEFRSVLADYPQLAPLYSYSTLGEMGFQICQEWNSGQANPIENEPVTSRVPTLILAGEYDPITPPAWGLRVTETLENSYYYEYPGVGHGASSVDGCPRQMMLAFIDDPSQAPDNTCIEEMEFEFVTPIDLNKLSFAPVEVPDIGIQASIPEGWTQVQPEYYISPDQSIEIVLTQSQDTAPEDFLQRWGASEPIDQIQVNDLTWTLYPVAIKDLGAAGYAGVSPSQEGFYIVLVISMPDKQNELYETLFLPVVKSFKIEAP
jgi:pimeloyl-ACP methyl ester carboxylesterase